MKANHFFRMTLALFLILAAGCEKNKTFENSDYNAEITGFTADKCFCCWGWEIKIGDLTIKTDSLPDVSLIGYSISTPIPVRIETGKKKISCSGNPDYYEIKSLKLAK
jgi:hypothetical protein